MPISSTLRVAALAAIWLGLAGCAPRDAEVAPPVQRTTVSVAGQPVVVAAPSGFCIDGQSTRVSGSVAFVLVSDCQLLGFPTSRPDPVGAVMTARISEGLPGPADPAALQAFFATPEGRAVLGRSGDPERTRILSSHEGGGVLYVLVEDLGPQPVAGIAPQFWRAFLTVRGRTATLSVLEFAGSGLASDRKLGYLQSFAEAIRAANAEPAVAAAPAP